MADWAASLRTKAVRAVRIGRGYPHGHDTQNARRPFASSSSRRNRLHRHSRLSARRRCNLGGAPVRAAAPWSERLIAMGALGAAQPQRTAARFARLSALYSQSARFNCYMFVASICASQTWKPFGSGANSQLLAVDDEERTHASTPRRRHRDYSPRCRGRPGSRFNRRAFRPGRRLQRLRLLG